MSRRPAPDPELLRFPRRMYLIRSIGMILGCLCVAAVLHQQQVGVLLWGLLAFTALVWPHLAYGLARSSRDPRRTELRNLVIDSAIGGAWIALMQFALLPSLLLATMLTIDKIQVGVPGLWRRSSAALIGSCGVFALVAGFAFNPQTSLLVELACLPALVGYPLALAITSQRVARRVRRHNRELDLLNRTDVLTGLGNRRFLQSQAEQALQRRLASGRPASLLLLDIDHFKQLNDSLGHAVGDQVLRSVADVVSDHLRRIDSAGRFGGDELGIVLVDAGFREAARVAERIRLDVQAITVAGEPGVGCSISIGIAEAVDGHAGFNDWLQAADDALYRAKRAGRNRVAGPVLLPVDGLRAGTGLREPGVTDFDTLATPTSRLPALAIGAAHPIA